MQQDELSELIGEFLVESFENLDQLDRDFVELEECPDDIDTLASIFRTIHTIKGTCGFLGFERLEVLTHAGENLLSKLRDGEIRLTPIMTTSLLAMVDAVRTLLADIQETGFEGQVELDSLISRLAAMVDEPGDRLGDILVGLGIVGRDEAEIAQVRQQLGDDRMIGEILADQGGAVEDDVVEALQSQADRRASQSHSDATIRVDVGVLDGLMNLVGELVLARNQILQLVATSDAAQFGVPSQRLSLITTELQEGVMKTRMQPIGVVWGRFPRVVRDLAVSFGKQVRMDMDGAETELDKTIIEAIKDPLTHLVRNAVDHGIEAPEQRLAMGKPVEGRVKLRAFHEGGKVNIEISDDGAGIDVERLRTKAVERGVLSADQADRLGHREALALIFAPGLSTAEAVTNVSGRGVGMDVVKSNIERIGGSVDVTSELGQGTSIKVKIPLTLAIIPGLMVAAGGQRYAIPQISLLELVRLAGKQAATGIEYIHGAPVYRLRGRLLPIVDLAGELGITPTSGPNVINIVVLQADDRQFGLIVDDISDTQEIVVKPLGRQLGDVALFAGATILGDGRVALILDVLGIAQRSRVVSEAHERLVADDEDTGDGKEMTVPLLLVSAGGARVAMPLDAVERLEKFPVEMVETAEMREVVQYRGGILPLVSVGQRLGHHGGGNGDVLHVVVIEREGQHVGLVVDRVLDIVTSAVKLPTDGGAATALVGGRVTEIVDIVNIVNDSDIISTEPVGVMS